MDHTLQEFDAAGLSSVKISKLLGISEKVVRERLCLLRGYSKNEGRTHIGERRASYTVSFPAYAGRAIEDAAQKAKLPPNIWLKRYVMDQMGFGARPIELPAPSWVQDHAQRIEDEDTIRWHIYRNAALSLIGLPDWDGAQVAIFGMSRPDTRKALLSWSAYWDAVTGELCRGHTHEVLFDHFVHAFRRVIV